jgi:hypothetical protein
MKVAKKTATSAAARLAELPQAPTGGHSYHTNYNYTLAEYAREEYARLYSLWQQILRLNTAGIQQITLTGQTGTVTLPVQSVNSICGHLAEELGNRLGALEKDILGYEQTSLTEEADEREGEGNRAAFFSFCLPMRPMSDAEFAALPPEAQRAYDGYGTLARQSDAA